MLEIVPIYKETFDEKIELNYGFIVKINKSLLDPQINLNKEQNKFMFDVL